MDIVKLGREMKAEDLERILIQASHGNGDITRHNRKGLNVYDLSSGKVEHIKSKKSSRKGESYPARITFKEWVFDHLSVSIPYPNENGMVDQFYIKFGRMKKPKVVRDYLENVAKRVGEYRE